MRAPAARARLGGSGALAMKVYGHLRDAHSTSMAQKVTFAEEREITDSREIEAAVKQGTPNPQRN